MKAFLKNPMELILAAIIILLVVSSTLTAIGAKDARVRFLNAVPDGVPLDVYVYTNLVGGDLGLGDMSEYFRLESATYSFQAVATGSNGPVLAEIRLPLAEKIDYTVILTGSAGAIERIVLGRDREPVQGQQARLRIVHADPDLGAVDIAFKDGSTLFTGVGYLQNRGFVTLDVGAYAFEVRNAVDGSLLFDIPSQALGRGEQYTAVFVGGPARSLLLYEDTTNTWRKIQLR